MVIHKTHHAKEPTDGVDAARTLMIVHRFVR